MSAATQPPAAGHNNPPLDMLNLIDVARLDPGLRAAHKIDLDRVAELVAGKDRFLEKYAAGIPDADILGRAGDFVKQLRDAAKPLEQRRDAIKRSVIDGGKAIDNFFKREMTDKLKVAQTAVENKIVAYQIEQERLAAIARRAELIRQRDMADAAAKLAAAHPNSNAAIDLAVAAEQAAEDTAARASAPIEAVPVRSTLGASVGTRAAEKWELDDLMLLVKAVAAGTAPLNVLTTNDSILTVMARDKTRKDFPGLRFYTEMKANIR